MDKAQEKKSIREARANRPILAWLIDEGHEDLATMVATYDSDEDALCMRWPPDEAEILNRAKRAVERRMPASTRPVKGDL